MLCGTEALHLKTRTNRLLECRTSFIEKVKVRALKGAKKKIGVEGSFFFCTLKQRTEDEFQERLLEFSFSEPWPIDLYQAL